MRPIILNLNSFDKNRKFVADDFTIGYLRRIGQEMSAILTASEGIPVDQEKIDFINDAVALRVVPLVDRIRLGSMNGNCWKYSMASVFYVDTAGGIHPVLGFLEANGTEGIDLTTMAQHTT